MEPRQLAEALSALRIGLGLTLVAAPATFGGLFAGRRAARQASVITRGFGARDLAIGAGTLHALRSGGPVTGWLAAGVAADLADFAGPAFAGERMPAPGRVAMMAAGGSATLLGLWLVRALGGER